MIFGNDRIRAAVVAALVAAAVVCPGCSRGEPAGGGKASAPKAAGVAHVPAGEKAALSAGAYSLISPKVLGPLAGDPALKDLRKRGILKVAVRCDRPRMCMKMNYGVAAGFEVELMRKLAESGLGVKENILPEGAADADLRLNEKCADGKDGQAPGAGQAGPYFYSARTGWLCIGVARGGGPVREAVGRVLGHFYKTGTFQQVYKNWFVPETPDVEVRVP